MVTGRGTSPFSQCRHGSRHELFELLRDGASGLHSPSREHGEREEGKGVSLWELRAWEAKVGCSGRGSHGYGISELVGSLLAAWRGKGMAWERSRRVQGCSPSKELGRDGLVGEINDGVCGSVRGSVGEIGRDRELAERHGLTSSVVAELYAASSIYKRWKAVEGEGTAASSAAR